MWVVMMAGMMLPSAAPAILLYGTIVRRNGALVTWASTCRITSYNVCYTKLLRAECQQIDFDCFDPNTRHFDNECGCGCITE